MAAESKRTRFVLTLVGLALISGAALGVPLGAGLLGVGTADRGRELSTGGHDPDDEEAVVRAVQRVGPSVVKIAVTQGGYIDGLFGRVPVEQVGLGSGVIIDASGLVLTNHHVVEDAAEITVALPDGRVFEGTLVGSYPAADLAVVRIDGEDLPVAQLAPDEMLRVGQLVIAIGNPFGFDYSVTTGIISALGRELVVDAEQKIALTNLIQTDAAINPGNSGGPLLDREGRVIGINTAVLRASHGIQAQGLGFAIPIADALEVAGELVRYGRAVRLGILAGTLTPPIARAIEEATGVSLGTDRGVFVREVYAGSPADEAGLLPTDIIVEARGRPVHNVEELGRLVRALGPGGRLEVTVLRKGERLSLVAEL